MQTPWITRSANQSAMSVSIWNSSEATAAVAAKAAKARMWPTRADHPRADHAADHEAAGIGGGDQAGRELARRGEAEPHRQQRAERAVRDLEDRRGEDHRDERDEVATQHPGRVRDSERAP